MIHKQIMFFRRTNFPAKLCSVMAVTQYIDMGSFYAGRICRRTKRWLYKEQHRDCAVSMQQTSDGVTSSRIVHRLGRCCLWWTALPSHGIGSASVSLILLLLLTVDSDDWNEVTLLFQPTCIQSCSIANMI